jgi:hypothetical protein
MNSVFLVVEHQKIAQSRKSTLCQNFCASNTSNKEVKNAGKLKL